ncbi:MAG: heparinase II/III family protein [Planctomycetes bacterium]|nr:heparinase II/III family protein [Planctomycetota bacterium]
MRRGILADRRELRELRSLIGRKAFAGIYETLRRRCALILESAPATETQWRSLGLQGHWGSAIQAARTVQGRVIDLLVAHHIDANTAYRDRAFEELRQLASWSTWVDPCSNHDWADLCTGEAAVAMAVGLDWLWEDLSDGDRRGLLDALHRRAIEPFIHGVASGAVWANCYHNWNAVVNGGVGLAALAMSDADALAGRAYAQARENLRRFFAALGPEGGWDEGTGYWGYAMRYVLLLAEAARRLDDDESILHNRGMDATGLFPIYFTPNGQAASFGDAPAVPLMGTFYLLARHLGRREVTWWLDTYAFHRDVTTTGWAAAGLAMIFRPPNARTPRKVALKAVKVFRQVGWAAMADRWPRPAMYVAAKAGDLSAHHSQRDMNSIQLQVDGEMLLTDLGDAPFSREYLFDGRGGFYEAQARAHNTVIVAERDHEIDAHGQIVESASAAGFRYVACDAGGALGENTRFVRHVVMLVEPRDQLGWAVVVLDELYNAVPEKVETFWHTQGRISMDERGRSGVITGRKAEMCFALAATVPMRLAVGSYPIDRRRRDNVLEISAGVIGRALTLSVFARRPVGELPAPRQEADGTVGVRVGQSSLTFAQGRGRLVLRAVETVDTPRPGQ